MAPTVVTIRKQVEWVVPSRRDAARRSALGLDQELSVPGMGKGFPGTKMLPGTAQVALGIV
jgi:hypothetical protein